MLYAVYYRPLFSRSVGAHAKPYGDFPFPLVNYENCGKPNTLSYNRYVHITHVYNIGIEIHRVGLPIVSFH